MALLPRGATRRDLQEWQPRLWAVVLGLLVLVAYVIAFVLENRRQVPLHFVLFTAHVSLIWLILLSVGIGFLGGILLSQLYGRRLRGTGKAPRDIAHGGGQANRAGVDVGGRSAAEREPR